MAHGEQHEDGATVGHGVQCCGSEDGHTMDDIGIQPHFQKLGSDQGEGYQLAGGRAAGEHAHQSHHYGANDNGRGVDAGGGVQHGLESRGIGDDSRKAADRGNIHGHWNRVHCGAAQQFLEVFSSQPLPEEDDGQQAAED